MRRIVLDAQYSVMTSALTMALKHGRPDFQVQNAGPKTKDIIKLCRSCRADVLLLEVCPHPPRTLQDRLLLVNDLLDVARAAKRYCLWMRPNTRSWLPPSAWQRKTVSSMILCMPLFRRPI